MLRLTKNRVDKDLLKVRLNIDNTIIKMNSTKYMLNSSIVKNKWLYELKMSALKFKFKQYKIREKALTMLSIYPNVIDGISLKDYKDTTKLYLILYQNDCVSNFDKQQKDIQYIMKCLDKFKVHIN